jgi:hypothetical protein
MDNLPFTDRVREVIHLAHQEAKRLRHGQVNSGHLLLGLIDEGQGVAVHILKNLGVDLDRLRREVEDSLFHCETGNAEIGQLSLSSDAKNAFRCAAEEAGCLRHNYIGSEHLLLGLRGVHNGIAGHALREAGTDLTTVRTEVCRVLGVPAACGKRPRSMSSYDLGGPVRRLFGGLFFLLMALTLSGFAVAIIVGLANGALPAAPWKVGLMKILPELLAVAAIFMLILAILAWTGGSRWAESLLRKIMPEATVAIFALFLMIVFVAGVGDPRFIVLLAITYAVVFILSVIVLRIRNRRQIRRDQSREVAEQCRRAERQARTRRQA